MATMDVNDDEDIWANTTSPSASPPQPAAAAFISTQLSLSSRLHLLSSAAAHGGSPPDHSGIFAADGGVRHQHEGLGGGFRNAAASPAPSFFPYGLDAGGARSALEHEMCLGPAGAVGGSDRRKKRMIKNRESAARSRARKQAYIRELEREVKFLEQENQSLRVKYEQVRVRSSEISHESELILSFFLIDSAAEGLRGGAGTAAGEEDAAENAIRAILSSCFFWW
jgi:hypothetical protein